jgi:outer membrane immunogenic protein
MSSFAHRWMGRGLLQGVIAIAGISWCWTISPANAAPPAPSPWDVAFCSAIQQDYVFRGVTQPARCSTSAWIGLNGGFAVGTGNYNEAGGGTGNFSTSGGTFGGTLGFGARIRQLKLGVEADLNWANFNGSSNVNCAVGCGVNNHWFGTVRPLVGVQIGDTGVIPYVTGGLAFGNVTANVGGFPGISQTNVGWTVGGGIAFPLGIWAGHNVVGKFEYLHLDLGSVQCTPTTCGGTADVKSTLEVLRAGVNYRF